jgi:hypothetical protein
MRNLKERLIRLGSEKPKLRKHLRPVLDKVSALERWALFCDFVYAEKVAHFFNRKDKIHERDLDRVAEIRRDGTTSTIVGKEGVSEKNVRREARRISKDLDIDVDYGTVPLSDPDKILY